jgi:hypothetical protein
METTPPDMAPIWNPLSVLPISAGTTISTLNTTQLSDTSPEEVTLSKLFQISLVSKIPRKYSISEKQLLYSYGRS